MKYLLLLIPYGLLVYFSGIKVQEWLAADYQRYLDSFDGWTMYISPFDFSWGFWVFMWIVGTLAIIALIMLIRTIRKEKLTSSSTKQRG